MRKLKIMQLRIRIPEAFRAKLRLVAHCGWIGSKRRSEAKTRKLMQSLLEGEVDQAKAIERHRRDEAIQLQRSKDSHPTAAELLVPLTGAQRLEVARLELINRAGPMDDPQARKLAWYRNHAEGREDRWMARPGWRFRSGFAPDDRDRYKKLIENDVSSMQEFSIFPEAVWQERRERTGFEELLGPYERPLSGAGWLWLGRVEEAYRTHGVLHSQADLEIAAAGRNHMQGRFRWSWDHHLFETGLVLQDGDEEDAYGRCHHH
jgi:hypothetical protein